jgi:hypothetical protein
LGGEGADRAEKDARLSAVFLGSRKGLRKGLRKGWREELRKRWRKGVEDRIEEGEEDGDNGGVEGKDAAELKREKCAAGLGKGRDPDRGGQWMWKGRM